MLYTGMWAAVVFGILVTAVGAVPVEAAARWLHRELACRRELRMMSALDVGVFSAPPVATPTLHQLRESA